MLRELKTFLAVVRWGTFAAAGSRIGLTQSAVSAQMQRLEEALGAPLFTRTGRSATLNEAGEEAVEMARQIVGLFDELAVRVTSRELRGTVRMGAIQTAQVGMLPGALGILRDRHPLVSVRLVHGSSLFLIGQVDSGELDAALMIAPPFMLPRELLWQPLVREPFVLAVPGEVPGDDWRQLLATHPFIRYDRASFGGRGVEHFLRRHDLQVEAMLDIEDVDAMVAMVAAGLGVSLVPVTRRNCLPPGVRAVSLGDDIFHRELGLVMPREPRRRELLNVLRECLEVAARPHAAESEALARPPAASSRS
ncbi:LysR substrate-binding domain-containing protein [Pigmentiphaga kullae]|uniref:DNA-binding transcriptional LysR family regulator n=1 Tax=Pigmentiphaga kullae TaxID=151784 RepID=A0A4Q7NDJ6_9BURK|nr:LysR substrate-binding domain-containing protein [Pigmentiphaga kullae]RZS80757.1 DNA-binding transcriptional LysR family regulator [Pigmentiphaga kullae]